MTGVPRGDPLGGTTILTSSLSTNPDGSILIIRAQGVLTREELRPILDQACALAKELEVRRFLLDMRDAPSREDVGQTYAIAYEDLRRSCGVAWGPRLALLVAGGDTSYDFLETVCRNAGVNLTLFRSEGDAMAHLAA